MKFTRKDEDKLVVLFRTYTKQELNEFIGRAIAERLLLTLGLTKDNERIPETLGMLNVLSNATSLSSSFLVNFIVYASFPASGVPSLQPLALCSGR